MLKTVFSVMWMLFLFISSSNINSQFIDRASNRVYAQEMQIPLQEMTCSDGTAPDVTTGLCADGSQPQPRTTPENVSGAAGGVTTEEQLVCSDGTAPDVTTGLCADGSQPQPQGQAPENVSGGRWWCNH